MKKVFAYILALVAIVSSCSKMTEGGTGGVGHYRNVMILYSAGYNNLSGSLLGNIEELKSGYVPVDVSTNDALLVFNRRTASYNNFKVDVAPVLLEIKKNWQGAIIVDTIKVWDSGMLASSAETMNEVLTFVKEQYPASGYGMVFSSHGTGWLPEGYYSNPENDGDEGEIWSVRRRVRRIRDFDPEPLTKSLGADYLGPLEDLESHEIEIQDLAKAIPMHLDYLLLDACLMGCIEVAYELRDKVDIIGFSPTEVLSQGFYYNSMGQFLLGGAVPDPVSVCRDYINKYLNGNNTKAATVSVVDCRRIEPLAVLCRDLFEKYRSQLDALTGSGIQVYFRQDKHWFYDLEDVLVHAGITQAEKAELEQLLDDVILYKGHTDKFFSIDIVNYSGLSMFLPSKGGEQLRTYYKENLAWNKATSLVK